MAIFVTGRVRRVMADQAAGSDDFDGVREVRGMVAARSQGKRRTSRELLQATYIACRASNTIARADRCVGCKRFVNFVPSPDRTEVTIRCAWSGDELVTELMVPIARLLAVPASSRAVEARHLASDYEQDLLLVVDGGVLVGVVRRRILEWSAADREVRSLIERRTWIASPRATLADIARMLIDEPLDAVMVAEEGDLLGVITRSDLRDVGCLQ